ncbi:class F sortase [Micromonospora sp. NBS 11-29]|uniref:class F sortase n=1 Tax=Micromonospora sp. NBS 11-29 TaxID=1960879 RepID=UPI003F8F3D75
MATTDSADPAAAGDADVEDTAPWDVPSTASGPSEPAWPTWPTPSGPAQPTPSSPTPTSPGPTRAAPGTTPAAPAPPGAPTGPGAPGAPALPPGAPVALPRSVPTTISIPRIGVRAEIMTLGTNPDGTVQVPPLDQAMKAGWYSPGASPGEVGNAVVVGHVDSAKLGPAVFFSLGALVRGDTIAVTRQDGSTVTFTVDEVRSYPKTAFPAEQVYGPSGVPGLRVVTCGGVFDRTAGSYLNNIVVYAHMTA